MGSAQSSHATKTKASVPKGKPEESSVRGRKAVENNNIEEVPVETILDDTESSTEDDSDYDSSDEEDEEEDEEMMERLRVLQDARMLKQLAQAFLHPEKPVVTTDPTVFGRNYYGRASAPQQETEEEVEERFQILEDAKALKQQAVAYAHPEVPVTETTDPAAFARCYFNRASAPEQETEEDAEERERVLTEANALKKLAGDYAHPELPLETTDATACARCYFDRASAPEQETEEEADERVCILADARALKKLAESYAHPEKPVVTEDPTAYGRNYYGRASAPEQETEEDAEERNLIVEDMLALKKQATMFAHPEVGVKSTDPTAYGRNYFGRASAPEQETEEDAEEHDLIMEDLMALKKQAQAFLHPEEPVKTDPAGVARCYYDRASAPEQETEEFAEERARILEESQALKQQATVYAHPEVGVKTTDPSCFARCFFNRPFAPEQETEEFVEERLQILADSKALKEQATSFAHPEVPVVTTDPFSYGRNYYGRASAPEQETEEFAEERLQSLAESMLLKQQVAAYAHPEVPVATTDSTAYGRNYYDRASALEQETEEGAAERELIMKELMLLKQLAVDFAHPELPVETTDPTACGRNYYDRPSAKRVHDFISSTSEDPFEPIKDPVDLDECDLHYGVFDWEEDTYLDIRHQLESLGDSARFHTHEVPLGDKDKDNEVLSRSPSSIMLFGGYEEAELVDRFSIDLRETV